ncbi:hypothetical protein FQN60_012500 [Etheostoma spectabile]|uniref:Uncharacterized protein n=1 Tax=Etheostoma spectabile TaxID=54343 RepID=A0A5J5DPT7_9PERO|nr:hypothetical protein FQN60_012500 [Etheostoma spectabile]
MEATDVLKLRVILDDVNAERLILPYRPETDKSNITAARTAALAGLPLYSKEDSSEVFKTCKDELEATQDGAAVLGAVVDEEEVPAGVPFETHHDQLSLRIRL